MADACPDEEGRLRVRRTRSQVSWPEPALLAAAFEEDQSIRALYRENRGHLLRWPSPELVGVASLKALALNVRVLDTALRIWGQATPVPKGMSVDWLKKEATCLHLNGYRLMRAPS